MNGDVVSHGIVELGLWGNMHEQSMTHNLLENKEARPRCFCKVIRCSGHISASTRPHQLHWGVQEIGYDLGCVHVIGRIKDSEHAEEKEEWPIHTSISHGFRLVSIMMSYLHAENDDVIFSNGWQCMNTCGDSTWK